MLELLQIFHDKRNNVHKLWEKNFLHGFLEFDQVRDPHVVSIAFFISQYFEIPYPVCRWIRCSRDTTLHSSWDCLSSLEVSNFYWRIFIHFAHSIHRIPFQVQSVSQSNRQLIVLLRESQLVQCISNHSISRNSKENVLRTILEILLMLRR